MSPYPVNSKKLNDLGINILSSKFSSRENLNDHISCYTSGDNFSENFNNWIIAHNFFNKSISKNSRDTILNSFKYIHKKLGDKASTVMGINKNVNYQDAVLDDYQNLFQKDDQSFFEYIKSTPICSKTKNHVLNVFDCLDDNEYLNSILKIGEEMKNWK